MSLILDSGAFSAWSKGVKIDIDDYISYAVEHKDKYDLIVNLDVIPATPGQKKIPQEEIERSAKAGWANYRKMEAAGIPSEKLVHVFHQNENFKWLVRMAKNLPYIGLSPANDRTTDEKIQWLDDCMKYVLDSDGYPIVKFHGFAVTSLKIMKRYPWYSVDSSTWCVTAGRGIIYIPRWKNGKWDYWEPPTNLNVSSSLSDSDHFENVGPTRQKEILNYLESIGMPYGVTDFVEVRKDYKVPKKSKTERLVKEREAANLQLDSSKQWLAVTKQEGVSNNYHLRYEANAMFINELQKLFPKWPWSYQRKSAKLL